MKVMKFGGSSVADGERIVAMTDIVRAHVTDEGVIVVLSAMKGITNTLLEAAERAERGETTYQTTLDEVRTCHHQAIAYLLPSVDAPIARQAVEAVDVLIEELSDILRGVSLVRECSVRTRDLVVSFGERLNCRIVAAYLNSVGHRACYVDAREIIVTNDSHGSAVVDYQETYRRARTVLAGCEGTPVVTGFIAATKGGVTTTLGRNGSDYTAAIVGAAVDARAVEIWTDVDGVLSADPRCVEDAFVVPEIGIKEAMELSYFGAEVIHPYTMLPAIERDIPLWIKNTLNPTARGTRISTTPERGENDITGIASISNVALINIEGGGMLGIPGMASRVFGALAKASVNVIMISQASSEHTICVCVREHQLSRAVRFLREELANELAHRRIEEFQERPGLEIVAVIGAKMRGLPGISGRVFQALGEHEINVQAIAQGSSEMNISFVIDRDDRRRALNIVHEAFFGSKRASVSV